MKKSSYLGLAVSPLKKTSRRSGERAGLGLAGPSRERERESEREKDGGERGVGWGGWMRARGGQELCIV